MGKATGPTYIVAFKRRRKHLTDYSQRLGLVKSKLPRLVVRRSGRHVLVQLVEFAANGDRVIACASSKSLGKYRWPARRNAPTAYLTGLLAGRAAKQKGVSKFVVDIGLHTPSKGSVIFAAVKGAVDAGLVTNYGKELVDEKRLSGEHIAAYAKKLRGTPEYDRLYSSYLKESVKPEELPELFKSAKAQLEAEGA